MSEQLIDILQSIGRPKVLVVGDAILDHYVWGDVSRISDEAPIQILRVNNEEIRLGGAGNVVSDLHVLGAEVTYCAIVGGDGRGRMFREQLTGRGLSDKILLSDPARPTTVKTRFIARSQQVLRVDHEVTEPFARTLCDQLIAGIENALPQQDIVVVEDYNKGLLANGVMEAIAKAASRHRKKIILDPAKISDWTRYQGVAAATPNRTEAHLATGVEITDDATATRAAELILQRYGLEAAIITLDRDGISLLERGGRFVRFPAAARDVYDVTGAGDMVTSLLALVAGAGHPWDAAVRLANVAAGIEVAKVGVVPVARDEIIDSLRHSVTFTTEKVKTLEELLNALQPLRSKGRKIVFTNGCFDILHTGHMQLLRGAREQGDVLVVGVNTDVSVRRLKGERRPIIPQHERGQLLSALAAVDYVVFFDEDTPERLIHAIRPDFLVKGSDYREDQVVGGDFVTSYGGKVVLVPILEGISTTDIVGKILSTHSGAKPRNEPKKPAQ